MQKQCEALSKFSKLVHLKLPHVFGEYQRVTKNCAQPFEQNSHVNFMFMVSCDTERHMNKINLITSNGHNMRYN